MNHPIASKTAKENKLTSLREWIWASPKFPTLLDSCLFYLVLACNFIHIAYHLSLCKLYVVDMVVLMLVAMLYVVCECIVVNSIFNMLSFTRCGSAPIINSYYPKQAIYVDISRNNKTCALGHYNI